MQALSAARAFARKHGTRLRLAAVVLILFALWLGAWAGGLLDGLDVATIRAQAEAWGWLGPGIFLLAFCALNLVQVPSMLLVLAAVVIWGPLAGGTLGFIGSMVACTTTFLLVRAVGGRALGGVRRPWARRMLESLDRRPILTIVVLRTVMQGAAALNATLALTTLSLSRYLLGTALGLIVPVLVVALLTEMFL